MQSPSPQGAIGPALSSILITPDDYAAIAQTMQHLGARTIAEQSGLVLIGPGADRIHIPPEEQALFHSVRFVEVTPRGSLAEARAAGVAAASAPVVAFNEDHSFPEPGWAAALVDAVQDPARRARPARGAWLVGVTGAARLPVAVNPQAGLASGTFLVMAAEALAFPAGLVATILLTRHLTPSGYGALALALAGTAWLEWTVVSLFARAAWKLIADAATALRIPPLAPVLRVLAFEIPIFVIAHGYRTVLIGRGLHGSRAAVTAVRWTVRTLLIALLRGILLGGAAGWIASAWQATGYAVLAALAALTVMLAAAMYLTGELRAEERDGLKRWTRALLRPAAVLP